MSGSNNNNNSKEWITLILRDENNSELTQFDMHIKGKENNWDQITKDAIALLKKLPHTNKLLKGKNIETSVSADKKSLIVKLTGEEMNGGRRRRSRKARKTRKSKTRRSHK